MREQGDGRVVIVDYGVGNVFSVQHACQAAGLQAAVSSSREALLDADAVILPGVGAFSDAMDALKRLDLIGPIKDFSATSKPLIGICLGMQLLMTEGTEFGTREGLGLIEGVVERLSVEAEGERRFKVPHVGWNRIFKPKALSGQPSRGAIERDPWLGMPLAGLDEGEFMYFVHSYYVLPKYQDVVLSLSRYGHAEFCSSINSGNIFGFQFHPERSGPAGLKIYQNLAGLIAQQAQVIR